MLVRRLLSHRAWAVLAVAGLLFLAGCPGGSGPTGTVSGTVTLNGEPVPAGCTVAFISDEGHTASGKVGAGGKYQLSVAGEGDAIPAASYKVCVTPPAEGEMSQADYDAMMQSETAGGAPQEAESEAAGEAIPEKYRTTGTSGLLFEVKPGPNTIDITLE